MIGNYSDSHDTRVIFQQVYENFLLVISFEVIKTTRGLNLSRIERFKK